MSEFLYDKAFMALKSKRYEEAQNAYEKILENGYSVDAWTGLGVCKMFQLADNVNMEEVIYCFSKAKEVKGANVNEIELKLISYALLVCEAYGVFAVTSIKNALEAERKAKIAAYVALGSALVGGLSDNMSTKVVAGVAAGAAGGVAIGQFGKALSSAALAELALGLLNNIKNNVNTFIADSEISELSQFNTRIKHVRKEIKHTDPRIEKGEELKKAALEDLRELKELEKEENARIEKERPIRKELNKKIKKSDHADVQALVKKLSVKTKSGKVMISDTEYPSSWWGPVVDVEAKPWDLGIEIFGDCKEGDGSIGGMNQDLINSKTEDFLFLIRDNNGSAVVWFTTENIYCWESTLQKKSPYLKVYDFKQPFLSSKWKSKTLDMSFNIGVKKDYQALMIDSLTDFINTRANQVTSDDSLKEDGIKDSTKQDSVIDSPKDAQNNDIKNIDDIFNLNKVKNGIVLDPDTAINTIKTGMSKWYNEYDIEGEVLFGLKCGPALNEIVTKEGIYRQKKGAEPDFTAFHEIKEFSFVKTGFFKQNQLIDNETGMSILLSQHTPEGNLGVDKGSLIIPVLLSYLNQLAKD